MSGGYQQRIGHQDLPVDAYLQQQLGEIILAQLRTVRAESQALSGFYRNRARSEVYFLDQPSVTLCHVQNPMQMDAYGGFGRVTIVEGDSFATGLRATGECSWPDGMYKTLSNPAVYLLHENGRSACWIRTPAEVEQRGGWSRVKVVDDTSHLFLGRQYRDRC